MLRVPERLRPEGWEGLGTGERSANASRRRGTSPQAPSRSWGSRQGAGGPGRCWDGPTPGPRVPVASASHGAPRSALCTPASWLLVVSLVGFFVVPELYLLSATSFHSRRCRQLWGRFCPMAGAFGRLTELLWPWFPHLSKGSNGGARPNEAGSALALCSPSPKCPLLWGLSFPFPQPVWRQPCPSDSPAVTQSLASAQRLPPGEPAAWSWLVQDSGPASTVFGKENSSAP